jgi:hypothetical protein
MGVLEREVALFIVIEFPGLPVVGVVAVLAVPTKPLFVVVVLCVAVVALDFGFLEIAGGMAFFAGQGTVRAQQGKTGNVVVKFHFGEPAINVMAVVTFFTLLACVRILVFMATVAFYRDFIFEPVGMALLATHILVFTQ